MTQLFGLADCNNFYASCEQVFQPQLRGKPTVVLSNNDGCVIARSAEAKALGVPFGIPHFKIRNIPGFQKIQVRSANFTLYGDMSSRVMATISSHVPSIEIYSIDECFIDYNGVAHAQDNAKRLCETVYKWTGISICIGLGPTKTLAKLANQKAKKITSKVVDLSNIDTCQAALAETEIGDVWGIGRRWAAQLQMQGIHTAQDFARMDRRLVRNMMGVVGLRTADELNGTSCLNLEQLTPNKQSLCISRSFEKTIRAHAELEKRIHYFTNRVAEKLRRSGLVTSAISIFVQGNLFRKELPQYSNNVTISLGGPTSDTGEIVKAALYGLVKIYQPNIPYKKAGVILLDLHRVGTAPPHLFTQPNPRRETLMRTIDQLNHKFGSKTISYGQIPQSRTWYMNQKSKSHRFTTHWKELLVAK